MAETKLMLASASAVKSGHLTKGQAESLKSLILSKNAAVLELLPILDKPSYEAEFATQAKKILNPSGSSNNNGLSVSTAGVPDPNAGFDVSPGGGNTRLSAGVSPLKMRRAQQKDISVTTTPNTEEPQSASSARPKPLNLTVVAATPATQEEDEDQADELLKNKRNRQLKRQSMPERSLPDSVKSELKPQ